ncbi:hypothetical protein E2C01_078830 [Portunus trituberculatus]|uniref:Uncharacterized protein n=1 Tax=Portunus trituberculatus TaxID=210409 RepID=A0A5B7INW5_PORTR|nr:hypothetical protein [Portunus trituberculatus]
MVVVVMVVVMVVVITRARIFEEIIETLDDSDSSAVRIVKELLQDKELFNDLAFIAARGHQRTGEKKHASD